MTKGQQYVDDIFLQYQKLKFTKDSQARGSHRY